MIEFQAWPKTPRLFRDVTITEKIDGTNAAVIIEPHEGGARITSGGMTFAQRDGEWFEVGAQSRKRLITPQSDNFGFASWVYDNVALLVEVLGPGRHFGEWWGAGIQRGYGLGGKRFSLFNTHKWYGPWQAGVLDVVPALDVVPILYCGPFTSDVVENVYIDLMVEGSRAAPGFAPPEGVVVYHHHSGQGFKVTEHDELHKYEREAA